MDPKTGQIHELMTEDKAKEAIARIKEAAAKDAGEGKKLTVDSLASGALMTAEEAKRRGLVPIPPEDIDRVRGMNRRQRRRWAALQRKKAGT